MRLNYLVGSTRWLLRASMSLMVVVALWFTCVQCFDIPPYILPAPDLVLMAGLEESALLLQHGQVTLLETMLGLVLGLSFGLAISLLMLSFPRVKRFLLPMLIASQAIPTFAIAPLLVLWLGYGVASKVVIAMLFIFFSVTVNCFDGLSRTNQGYLDLSRTMGANRWQQLRYIRFPAALPAIASGVKIAVVMAPIGAVVGEWIGASEGLGYFMMYCNARMEIPQMYAALCLLSFGAIVLYFLVDLSAKHFIHWQKIN